MTQPPRTARYWLAMLWLGLLLAGCLSQMSLLQSPKPGAAGFAPEAVTLVKPNPQGNGAWVPTADGKTRLTVRIGMAQPPTGSFATQRLDLSTIAKVMAFISLANTGITIAPTNVDGQGYVSAPSGSFSLTFPPIDKGTKRILSITGYTAGNQAVPNAVIKSLFDNTADTGTFDISYRTTPAVTVFQGVNATVAAGTTLTTAGLQAAIDAITGFNGTAGAYPQCPPMLVATSALITALNGNGGDTAPIIANPSAYRQAGTEVSHTFYLPPNPQPADMPQLFCSDPTSEIFDLGPLAASTGTFTSPNGSVTATIAASGQVNVTFHKIPNGTWKIGAKLPGDGTTPNPKYYQVATNVCGSVASVTTAGGSVTTFTTEAYRAAEPLYVTGQIRWRKTTATGNLVQDLATTLPTVLSAAAPSDSTDFTVYVGPSAAGYTFAGNLIPSGAITGLQILGPPNVAEANRPRLTFGTTNTFQVSSSGAAVRDLDINGALVTLANGGTLQRVSVEGQRITSGHGAAIAVAGSSAFLLDGVHVYDVRHTAASPVQGTDSLVGISVGTTGTGQILNSLVDDKASNSGTFSIRYAANASSGSLAGITVQAAAGITIANTNVVAVGRITGSGITPAQTVAGITTLGTSPVRIANCTVSNVEALRDETGIHLATGTVANCTVENLATPTGPMAAITGIRVGAPGGGGGAAEVLQNTVRNLGETATPSITGSRVVGIQLTAPNTGTTLKADGNTVTTSGAMILTGILLEQFNGSPSTFLIANNAVTSCQTLPNNGQSNFGGIDVKGTGNSLNNLSINHNDVSGNTMHASGFGIRADSSAGTATFSNNRVANNSLSSSANTFTGTQNYRMIGINGNGASVVNTIKNNLVTGNTLNDNTGTPETANVWGINATGGTGVNTVIQNNQIAGNTWNLSGPDSGDVRHIDTTGSSKVLSNRIFDNTLSASFPSTSPVSAIMANVTGTGQTLFVERNIVFDAQFGKQTAWKTVTMTVASPATASVRHNSFSVADSAAPCLVILANGDVEIVNNAMATAQSTGPAAAINRGIGALGTPLIDSNWINGWGTPFILLSGTNTVTSSPVFGTSSATANVGAHLMGTNGTTGYNGGKIGAEGSYAGVAALDVAPVY